LIFEVAASKMVLISDIKKSFERRSR
jgi:hypothetical protein